MWKNMGKISLPRQHPSTSPKKNCLQFNVCVAMSYNALVAWLVAVGNISIAQDQKNGNNPRT
jgi:hypothetical protein